MLADVEYRVACGSYDFQCWVRSYGLTVENTLASVKSALAKSLVENTARNLRSLESLGQGAGRISLVFTDCPKPLELRKENAVQELPQRLIDGSGRHTLRMSLGLITLPPLLDGPFTLLLV